MRSAIASLRDIVPIRPLTQVEAFGIAEHQATRFLKLVDVTAPPMADAAITTLTRRQVERVTLGDTAGTTQGTRGRGRSGLNAQAEPDIRGYRTRARTSQT